jgi:hypothetical protein
MATGGSILSFPDRGPWGDPGYRGNCSGYVYREIFEALHPRVFTDPMVGGGTSVEVAWEMGIEAHGLDLHSGFNILKQRILDAVYKPSDLVLSHPPYHNIVVYSGNVWGKAGHLDDLSRCTTEDEFVEKLTNAMKNQRHATRPAGYYGTIIGDVRRGGAYSSYQADLIARMPKKEPQAVLIKQQHNVASRGREYPLRLPRIMHEYVVLWQKRRIATVAVPRKGFLPDTPAP